MNADSFVDTNLLVYVRDASEPRRFRVSWWNSLIVSAALQTGCRYLPTEDLQEGQEFGELRVVNPFTQSPADIFNDL